MAGWCSRYAPGRVQLESWLNSCPDSVLRAFMLAITTACNQVLFTTADGDKVPLSVQFTPTRRAITATPSFGGSVKSGSLDFDVQCHQPVSPCLFRFVLALKRDKEAAAILSRHG